jgi:hypothetical protein
LELALGLAIFMCNGDKDLRRNSTVVADAFRHKIYRENDFGQTATFHREAIVKRSITNVPELRAGGPTIEPRAEKVARFVDVTKWIIRQNLGIERSYAANRVDTPRYLFLA